MNIKIGQQAAALNVAAKNTINKHWSEINSLISTWLQFSMPWLADKAKAMTQADMNALWRKAYSHLSEDELAKRIKDTASVLKPARPSDYKSAWAPPNMR